MLRRAAAGTPLESEKRERQMKNQGTLNNIRLDGGENVRGKVKVSERLEMENLGGLEALQRGRRERRKREEAPKEKQKWWKLPLSLWAQSTGQVVWG